ncbi:putative esterase [Shewanella sediminis HAW-EB3]|uniref:Putative esterase n=1 Tax=Shewanella sediminis (strain HAW-EB3) TaxID=425104 RepID=A8FY87_SHESH|nr:tetratricopeptide repeat protein [Shewanella sediminis]ABV37810.1 putative esterase [Shewanella sediminis HAW-EB3]
MPNKIKITILTLIAISFVFVNERAFAFGEHFKEITKPNEIRHIRVTEDISLDIYLPPGSNRSELLPTLYVMDSQHYMYNAIGYQQSLRFGVNISPKYIVVGINTEKLEASRGALLGGDADNMIALMENSIVPYIEENYPSNKRRMYFGWQFGAMFGIKLFNANPRLIEGYFLASGQNYSKEQQGKLEDNLKKNSGLGSYFYLSLGEMEHHTLDGHKAITSLFEKYKAAEINWKFSYFDRFSSRYDHHTTPLESLTHGLEWYFSDYPDLTFHSIDDITNFGGVAAIKAYYQNRAKRYQVSSDVSEQSKFSMFRHAAQVNDYKLFMSFEQELGIYEITGWYRFFAQFFLKNNEIKRAKDTYKKGLLEYPEKHSYWADLASIYENQQDYHKAIDCYQNALKYTQKSDLVFTKYKQNVIRLNDVL